jgi:cell division protein FtsB
MDRVALSTTVESLTFEVADVISVKNILKEDYNSLISKNELLEKECHALKAQQERFEESSRAQLQSQLQTSRRMSDTKLKTSQLDLAGQIRIKDEQIRLKDDQLKVKDDKVRVLLSSLAASAKQCADLESIPATLRELYKNLATTEADKRNQKVEIARLNEEVIQHKALIESLKRKVREMSGKDVAFLDSFEEVSSASYGVYSLNSYQS